MDIKFPHLNPWQSDVMDDLKAAKYDVYVVKSRRQVGKSVLAITAMLYFSFSGRAVCTCVEPTLSQSRRVFKQIVNAVGGEGSKVIKSANATLLSIEFTNGSEIIFKSAEQEEALRGMTVKNGILIIDEAAFIKDNIFEILYPVVDACHCPVMLLSTPLFLSGEFYNKYVMGLGDGIVHSYDWSKYDTSIYLDKEKLEYYRRTISPLKFKSEYLGEFIAEGSYVFGDIGQCVTDYSKEPPVYGGIDWSCGNDNDYSVLTLMDREGKVTHIYSYKDFTPTQLIGQFKEDIAAHPSLKCVLVETNSIGNVYMDFLKKEVRGGIIRGFNTTNESKRRIIEQLISAFQTGGVRVPSEPELLRELQHYNIEKTNSGKVTYNGADGVNDDYVLSLSFCYEAYKKGMGSFTFSFA